MPAPATERQLVAAIAAHESWANTTDRTARTAPARAALDRKFLDAAGGDPVRAEHLRKAHFKRLALKSAQARRKAKEATATAQAAEDELIELGEPPGPLAEATTAQRNTTAPGRPRREHGLRGDAA